MTTSATEEVDAENGAALPMKASAVRRRAARRKSSAISRWSRNAGLTVYSLWVIFPLYWLVKTSFNTGFTPSSLPPVWFGAFSLSAYRAVLSSPGLHSALLHSLIVALGVTLIAATCGSLAGYGLTHLRRSSRAAGNYEFWVLSSRMAPPIAVAIPMYFLYTHVHLEATLAGLIIAEVTTVVGIVTWIMIEAFRSIPIELTEAAEVDGCSSWRVFARVALPLARPGLVGAGTIAFLLTWNEFLLALILTNTKAQTAPLALYQYIGYETFNLGQLAAASCVVLVPTVLVIALFQKQLITGLTFGAVRG